MNRFKRYSQRFPAEAAAVGRLLAGYADLEIGLMHCVQIARDGDLDTVLKAMYGKRGETQRINTAHTLGKPAYDSLGLGSQFNSAIEDMKFCLSVRNCYAHSLWHDAVTGYLAFVNLEELEGTDDGHEPSWYYNTISRYKYIDGAGRIFGSRRSQPFFPEP